MHIYRFDVDIWIRHVPVEVSADSEIAAETALTLHPERYVDAMDIQDGWAIHINRIENDQDPAVEALRAETTWERPLAEHEQEYEHKEEETDAGL